ncbi:hypothetical protein CAPTEDRAFT_48192, partial [Capitella teleta]
WCCGNESLPWLQVDLGYSRSIYAIDTMGNPNINMLVKTFKIEYREDGQLWKWYTLNGLTKIFDGNTQTDVVVRNYFDPPIAARFVKLYPLQHENYRCMRWEMYTC